MKQLSQLHQDAIAAINLVPRFVADRFDMGRFHHPCRTPACAIGNLCALEPALGYRLKGFQLRSNPVWGALFHSRLERTIKTPAQWRDHAIAWLKLQGVDYYEVTGAVAETVDARSNSKALPLPSSSHAVELGCGSAVKLAGSNPASPTQSDAAAYRAFRRLIEGMTV